MVGKTKFDPIGFRHTPNQARMRIAAIAEGKAVESQTSPISDHLSTKKTYKKKHWNFAAQTNLYYKNQTYSMI